MHVFFGLSYANYLVIPRACTQSMPDEWQAKLVALLEEMHHTLDVKLPDYRVQAVEDGKFVKDSIPHYRRAPPLPRRP